MKIGLLVGSLRKDSWNKKVALNAKELFPKGVEGELVDLSNVPFYNEDLDGEHPHEEYLKIREKLRKYDGYIFFTPEYNRSLAPILKNVIDVGSRAKDGNIWAGKPAAVFSATMSDFGAMSGNHSLRESFIYVDLIPMQQPEIYLASIQDSFNENGEMTDRTKEFLEKGVFAFVDHVRKIK